MERVAEETFKEPEHEMSQEEFWGATVIPFLWNIKEMPLDCEGMTEEELKDLLHDFKEILGGHDACRIALDGWNQYVPDEIKKKYPKVPYEIYQMHKRAVETENADPNVTYPPDYRSCWGCRREDLREKLPDPEG